MTDAGGSDRVLFVGEGADESLAEALSSDGREVVRTTSTADALVRTDGEPFDCAVVAHPDAVAVVELLAERVPALSVVVVGDEERASAEPDVLAAGGDAYVERDERELLLARVARETERGAQVRTWQRDSTMLDSMLESLPLTVYFKDEEARFVRVSESVRRWYPDIIGSTDRDIWPEDAEETYADDLRILNGEAEIVDREEPKSDGSTTLTTKVPWRDNRGNVVGLLGVTRDITERKRRERQLRAQNERMEKFVGIVSHDLRTPLNVALGNTELAREQEDLEPLATVESSLERMDRLIEDLLTLARQGKIVTETESVELRRAVEDAWEGVQGGTLRLSVGSDVTIQADRERFVQLLDNLFKNAVDHAGPNVTVEAGVEPGTVRVADDGPGIPEEERGDIFDYGVTNTEGGTGFGLAIVRDIAEAHGWEVTITESDTGGARFEVHRVTTSGA